MKDIQQSPNRLVLRQWKQEDLEPFACLNADPKVMQCFPGLKTKKESDHSLEKCGWGFWAASLVETGEFIGFIGLEDVHFKTDFAPAVEIRGLR